MMIARDLQRTLPHAEQLALFAVKRTAGADSPEWRAARDRLILANRPLTIRSARHYVRLGLGLLLDDLVSAGLLGVIAAVDRFDLTRGLRFSTYAAPFIRRMIQDEVIRSAGLVRVPYQHHPVVAAADGLHDDPAVIAALGSLAVGTAGVVFDPLGEVSGQTGSPAGDGDLAVGVGAIIDRILPPVAAQVVRARLLPGDSDPAYFREIGRAYGFSQQRAQEIFRDALEEIRHPVAAYCADGVLPAHRERRAAS